MTRSTALVLALTMAAMVTPMPSWARERERRGPAIVGLVGLSELEIRRRMGRPTAVRSGEWIYGRAIRMRSPQRETVIRFVRGRVVDAFERELAIRCELLESIE